MSASSGMLRWLKVVLAGCALGVAFAFGSAVMLRSRLEPQRFSRPARVVESQGMAGARVSGQPVRKEVIQVIELQLAAFRKNDYPEAYRYAAESVKESVPLPAFERMVRNGYPVIARSSRADFGVILDNGDEATVSVVVSRGGRTVEYEYFMRRELTGWKVTGVIERMAGEMVI